jgi:hypothetical protein
MKRSFTLMLAAFLMLMTSFVWGQTRDEVVAYTLDGTITGGSSGYATESEITQNNLTWMVMGNTTMSPWRIGGKSLTNENRPVYSTGTMSDNITKIIVSHGTASGITVNSMTLIVSANSDFSNPTSTMTGDFVASSTTTFNRPTGIDWSNKYYKIIYNVTVSGSSNKYLQFESAEFYKENSGQQTVATPTFSPAAGTYYEAQNVTISCTTTGATIHYTVDGNDPTTSSAVYSSPIAISQTTTVKAMAVKSGMSNSSIASATYTIEAAPTPITIAAARALANNEYALVQGIVTFIDGRNVYVQDETAGIDLFLNNNTVPSGLALGDMVLAYGQKTVYKGLVELQNINGGEASQFSIISSGNTLPLAEKTIAEILTDHAGTQMLQSTRVKIVNATIGTINTSSNTPITQGDNSINIYKVPTLSGITAGDAVDVIGVVGCYNNPQIRVALANDVTIHETPMETVATPTFTPAEGEYTEAQSVTIACETEGATIYYTIDGTDPTENSTVYTEAIAISENTTVKAYAVKENMLDSDVATAEYTINIVPPTPSETSYKLITNANALVAGDKYIIVGIKGETYKALGKQATNNRPAVTVTPSNDTITVIPASAADEDAVFELTLGQENDKWTFYDAVNEGYLYAASSSANHLKTQAENNANGQWTIEIASSGVATIKAQGTNTRNWLRLNNNGSPFSCYASGQMDVYLYKAGDIPTPPTPTEYVATPTFAPAAGSYTSAQTVSIACTTEGATIYYTLDGTTPTTESTVYAEAFTVSETTTVKAFAVKEGMLDSEVATATYTIIEPMTIAAARALAINEYALVQGVVTFLEGRNVFIQDNTAGIDLYLNSNTVPSGLALGDMVKAYGKLANYGGLLELTGINGNNENQFIILSTGNTLPVAVKTIAEIVEDFNGSNALQATRVQIENATIGSINTGGNTTITQGDNSIIIYKIPAVEGLMEGDIVTITGVIGAFSNVLQLRVATAADVLFTHPAGITVNPTSLSGFSYVYEEGPSTVKTFTISGVSLTAPTYIYPSENYQISSFPGETFYPENMITINTTGTYNYTIKVRLKAGLEIGEYNESLTITQAEIDDITLPLSGNVTGNVPPQPQGDYTRVSDLSQVTSGSKVIFAARFDENADQYYAMTAQASGKPEGVLFTSVAGTAETLPAEITDVEDTFYWTVDVDGANYTFTNANGDVLGYNSSTNFANGGDNTAWAITFQTSEATAMVPEYSAFVINNVNNAVRAFALNSNHNFGPYHTQNMAADNYNFFIDMFATVGGGTLTCATPTFTPEAGTYYEAQEVTIACSTADATIYYTTDGTEPDENSAVYSAPISVAESMTIKAIAMKEGYENSNVATAEYIVILGAVTIFEQDWEGEMNGWTFVTVEGSKPWVISQYQGNHYAYGNGYNGGVNEQWCISPAFSLNVYSNASLTFRNAKNYTGPDMELFFSNDYDGSDPTSATWVALEYNKSTGSFAWAESGSIDLASFAGDECYIGFKYISTETEAAAWEVDDVTLMGFTTDPYLTVTPNALSGFTYIVGNGPSAVQTFTVSGGNLPTAPGGTSGGVSITCSNSHYEFSLDGEEYWHNLTIQVVGTLEPTTVYVRLEAGLYVGQWDGVVTFEDGGLEVTATVSGTVTEEPVPGGDWNRIYALSDLHDGDQVIIASRYDATVGDGYYAMTAGVSGKPDGVLFTSVNEGGVEKLPAEISDDSDTYMWNVTLDGDVITLTNAAGDMLGYSSSTNFSGNTSTDWNIALQTSEEGALIPNYTGFVITNAETTNRGVAKNSSNKFGAYSTSNISNTDYNFFMDLFVYGGSVTPTVATPVFSVASGTYYAAFEVEITCATEGATIYYTTDGSDPTAESEVYEEPIYVDSDITIKAIAMMEGYENSGIATASYIVMSDLVVLVNQDWEGEMDGWTFVTIEGNKPWVIGQYNNNHYANANGYGDDVNNEQWCISPAFNLNGRAYRNVTLTFMNATKFDGPALELYFSNDYDGQDPTAASWESLEYIPSEGNYTWTESGEISLDGFSGSNCYIAFRYISTIEEGAAAWEVDDIMITAEVVTSTITPDAALNVNVWNNSNELMIENGSDETLNMIVYNIVGQPVLSETVTTGSNVIRHSLAEGVYIVRLSDGKEMMGIKVVIRR